MIEVKDARGKGRGIFAAQTIKAYQPIEVAPYTRYVGREAGQLEESPVYWHMFVDPAKAADPQPDVLVVWGKMSLANHSDQPNAVVEWDYNLESGKAALIAVDDIAEGEEITLKYTNIDEYHTGRLF